jgi:Kef-type K+ transport system membrane component KefB
MMDWCVPATPELTPNGPMQLPSDPVPASTRTLRIVLAYGLMIVAAVVLFFAVRSYGETLQAAGTEVARRVPSQVGPALASHPFLHLLIALAAVILLGRILALLFVRLGQPPVIGEVLAGICLGPSLLGRVSPAACELILPAAVAPSLAVVAQIGVVLYMFVVGLELNPGVLRKQGHTTLAISHASIIVPFSLGAVLALWLYPMLSDPSVTFTAFALFLSVSMSVTAFPVLARILTDRQMHKTDLGVTALACAAIDDVTAWCLLALVVGVVQSKVNEAILVTLLTVAYIAFMLFVIRLILARLLSRYCAGGLTAGVFSLMLVGMLLSALTTEAIGVHAIFGAFLFGAAIPHDGRVAQELTERIEGLVTTLLLPAFFALVGMRTEIGLVSGWQNWLVCLVIIAVATLGKFGGTWAAACLVGKGWRDAASLGVLMNTRGLMELIVLNIGLDLGVISPTLFAMMVLMALVTTIATSPILYALVPHLATPQLQTAEQPAYNMNR